MESVETLHSLGEIIGVTSDGTNDGPALKTTIGLAGGRSQAESCRIPESIPITLTRW